MIMKMKNNLLWALSLVVMGSLLILTACGDDEPEPVAPVLSIDNGTFTGDIGDQVTAVISGELDGDFVSLAVTKFIGTTVDDTYGTGGTMEVTSGLPYTFNYTLGVDGLLEPIRFNFLVTDANGLTDEVDLIITTNVTRTGLLVSFNWRYTDLWFGDPLEPGFIAACEEDNIFSFESDGTMSFDFGDSGDGAGSCAGDGLIDYVGWTFDDAEEVLSLIRVDILEDGSTVPKDTLIWNIIEFDQTAFSATEESIFGALRYDYTAVAKD
jgi:hypothetical protein